MKKENNKTKKQPEVPTVIEYEEQPPFASPPKSEEKGSSSFSGFIVIVIMILFGLTMFDNNLPGVSTPLISNFFLATLVPTPVLSEQLLPR